MKSIFMLFNLSKIALFALLSVLITLFFIVTITFFTHAGNVYLLKIAQRIEPRLHVELVQGTFTRQPIYDVIQWQDKQTHINLNNVSYQFKWSCLLSKVCLQNLKIDSGDIFVQTAENTSQESEAGEPITSLPIDFAIDDIDLNNINFNVDGTKGSLGKLQLTGIGKKNNIEISANINKLFVDLPATKSQLATPKSSPSLDLTKPLISKENLPDIFIPFNIIIKPLSVTNLTITQDNVTLFKLNEFSTNTSFNESLLAINNLSLDLPETNLKLSGNIDFTENYPLDLHLQGTVKNISQLSPSNLLYNQKYDLLVSGDLTDVKTQLKLRNKLNINVKSQVQLMTQYIPYDIDISWEKLRWPLNGEVQYYSRQGHLNSTGAINDYLIDLKTDYVVENIPEGDVQLQGKGDLEQIDIQQLMVNTLDGNAQLSGKLNWKDAIKWAGDLTLNKIDIAQLDTGYTGDISGKIKQNFTLITPENQPSSWYFNIPEMDINGTVLAHTFVMNGVISGDSKNGILFNNVNLINEENSLKINGLYSKQSDLDVNLNINDLGDAVPGATGKITGNIDIQGEMDSLNILTKLDGNNVHYQANKLASFNLESSVKLSQFPSVDLTLLANNANVNGNIIDNVNLEISNIDSVNQGESHQVILAVKDSNNSADLDFLINQNKVGWSSQLTAGQIHLVDYLLTLNKVVNITPDEQNILVSSHCWDITHDNNEQVSQLCSGDLNIGEQGNADFSVKHFPLTALNEFINEPLTLNGNLNLDAKLTWIDLLNPQFDIEVNTNEMVINIDQDNDTLSYPVEKLNITLLNTGTTSDLNAIISSPTLLTTNITGQLSKNKQNINATLDLSVSDLSPLKDLTTQLEKLSGTLNANISFNGSIDKPKIDGQVDITNTTVYAVGSPLKINYLNSSIVINNNNAELEGSFYTEKYNDYTASKTILTNTVNFIDKSVHAVSNVVSKAKKNTPASNKAIISGNLNWDNELVGNIALTADKITINDYDKINLQVSPDLKLIFNDAITLTGNVLVDKGVISVNELADNGVAISSDVVVIDSETPIKEKSLPIIVDLNVDLGSQLQVKAMGLDSIISGDLQVKQPKNRTANVYGTLSLSDGTYTVLSQKLTLEDSEIIFQGPTETPYISIDAIRDPDNTEDDVTAGVKVTGTPDNLDISIYSDPDMSQQEALSYLIQGQSLSNSSGSDSQITNMLMILQMSAANSFGVLNTVGNKLGIENLSVASSGTGDEQSVGLSGYIAPKVQISYGIGVFDNFAKFAIRYEVFENFFLEASTGLSQAIDAYYQFDVD